MILYNLLLVTIITPTVINSVPFLPSQSPCHTHLTHAGPRAGREHAMACAADLPGPQLGTARVAVAGPSSEQADLAPRYVLQWNSSHKKL